MTLFASRHHSHDLFIVVVFQNPYFSTNVLLWWASHSFINILPLHYSTNLLFFIYASFSLFRCSSLLLQIVTLLVVFYHFFEAEVRDDLFIFDKGWFVFVENWLDWILIVKFPSGHSQFDMGFVVIIVGVPMPCFFVPIFLLSCWVEWLCV